MANLTITIDDGLLKRARVRAILQGTSVNALLREYLQAYAGAAAERMRATDRLMEIAAASRSGSKQPRWTRDELHER